MIVSEFFFTLIKDLITTIVEEIVLHERVTEEITRNIVTEHVTDLATHLCRIALEAESTLQQQFENLLESISTGKLIVLSLSVLQLLRRVRLFQIW